MSLDAGRVGLIGDIDCCCFVIDEAIEAFDLLDERLMRLALLLEAGVDVSVRGNLGIPLDCAIIREKEIKVGYLLEVFRFSNDRRSLFLCRRI